MNNDGLRKHMHFSQSVAYDLMYCKPDSGYKRKQMNKVNGCSFPLSRSSEGRSGEAHEKFWGENGEKKLLSGPKEKRAQNRERDKLCRTYGQKIINRKGSYEAFRNSLKFWSG